MTSVTVRANWPAKMSHSPHGECDIDAKRTDESPGFEQPARGADCIGSGGRVDGCQHTPRPPHHDRLREEGAAALAHGHRGRKPVNATPEAVIADVVRLAGTRYQGANHTHLSELLAEREGIDIGRTTLRRILLDAGLSSPRRRRPPKHRVRRQRMPRAGLIRSLNRQVTFLLNASADISPELRQPQPDDRAAHVVHFTAAVYTRRRHWQLRWPDGNGSPRRVAGCGHESTVAGRKPTPFRVEEK